MDIVSISSALTSLKAAKDLINNLRDLSKLSAKQEGVIRTLENEIIAAKEEVLEAKSEFFSIQERARQLKEEIVRIKNWETEKKRYTLVSPWQGAVLYAAKKSMSNREPPHYICANCYSDGKKSILTQRIKPSSFVELTCPNCEFAIESISRFSRGFPLKYAEEH